MLTRQIIQEWLSALTLMATIVFDKNTISINPFIPLNNYDPEFYDGSKIKIVSENNYLILVAQVSVLKNEGPALDFSFEDLDVFEAVEILAINYAKIKNKSFSMLYDCYINEAMLLIVPNIDFIELLSALNKEIRTYITENIWVLDKNLIIAAGAHAKLAEGFYFRSKPEDLSMDQMQKCLFGYTDKEGDLDLEVKASKRMLRGFRHASFKQKVERLIKNSSDVDTKAKKFPFIVLTNGLLPNLKDLLKEYQTKSFKERLDFVTSCLLQFFDFSFESKNAQIRHGDVHLENIAVDKDKQITLIREQNSNTEVLKGALIIFVDFGELKDYLPLISSQKRQSALSRDDKVLLGRPDTIFFKSLKHWWYTKNTPERMEKHDVILKILNLLALDDRDEAIFRNKYQTILKELHYYCFVSKGYDSLTNDDIKAKIKASKLEMIIFYADNTDVKSSSHSFLLSPTSSIGSSGSDFDSKQDGDSKEDKADGKDFD